mmetsp:Transcript_390/g.1485  ORF Transcript_390/g.1485 Transcript_390/m.1485 type:complete len:1680 (-) Transcript_390:151-5190(-)|eukprot:CAMPEP_0117451750 /NCGR_PEP_ID=MMETSP0759-20121206/9182_1 /TAXON_ID=63605 /ORGANISM="Percolomonas cosmopolitus, Strain WS" /LENGTH=1679 /DNA_ID=CAMNT_0005244387 /DNA_START=218 /DNA_END=5257 /DNA_ORIENTATION=+
MTNKNPTLQDILNTIQWDSYEAPSSPGRDDLAENENTQSDDNSEKAFMNSMMKERGMMVPNQHKQQHSHVDSRNSNRSTKSGNIAIVNNRHGVISSHQLRRRNLDTAQSTFTSNTGLSGTISMPSTPAYSTYSYFQDLDDEYERALNEFDEVEQEAMTFQAEDDSFEMDANFEEEGEFDNEDDSDTSYDTIDENHEERMQNKENFNTQNRIQEESSHNRIPPDQLPTRTASMQSQRTQNRVSRKRHRRGIANTSSRQNNRKRKHPDALTTLESARDSDTDSVELSQEQLYHLHLDNGELDNFRSSVLSIKKEMEHINFEEKKKNIELVQRELEHMERKQSRRRMRRQGDLEVPASADNISTNPIPGKNSPHSDSESNLSGDDASIDDSLSTHSAPQKIEDTLLKLKEEHYLTMRSGMETEDDPLHDLLKSVEEINMVAQEEEEAEGDGISLISASEAGDLASSRTTTPGVAASAKLRNSTLREKQILEQLEREQQEREEKKRRMKYEHRQRMEQIRREREEHEERVRREQHERIERERAREEAYRKEEEERRRENAIRLMRREEQLMRDYMFELQQRKLEEEQRQQELEEQRRMEWEAEQERIRQEELRKADERRKRLEQERKEREQLAHERFLQEQEENKRRELEEKRRIEAERLHKLEEERRQRELARRAYVLNLKKQHESHRLESKRSLKALQQRMTQTTTSHRATSSGSAPSEHSLLNVVKKWQSEHQSRYRSSRSRMDLSSQAPKLPSRSNDEEEVQLDDDLIEVLSGAFDPSSADTAQGDLVNLIVSVEKISSIGKVTRDDFTRVLSLVLDENSLRTLEGVDQFPVLRYLSAKLNDLRHLGDIRPLENLMELNVETNQLEHLQGIEGCNALRSINASHNKLSKLDHVTKCSRLSVLKLYRNNLTSLDFISHLDTLLELDVGRNQIASISSSTFNHSSLLQKLVLYQNQLEQMPPTHSNVLLRQLYLNGNTIENIDTSSLFHPLLEYLNVSDNKVASLSPLRHFVNLKNLNISFNTIGSLDELVNALQHCHIETLKANDNPVCATDGYRELMIALIPNLNVLDDEAVSQQERDQVEVYCTMRNSRRYSALKEYIERLSRENPFELMRQMRDENTMWYHICRDATREIDSLSDEDLAYRSMCARQSAEYIAFNSQCKKKLYIPLNKKTDQKKHKETLRFKEEYYSRWNALARKHQHEHENFNVQNQQNVVVHNNKFREEEAAIKIQRAFRAHRGERVTRSIVKIQAFVRGSMCRAKNLPWIIDKLRERHNAAIKIQTQWRGFRVRNALWKARQIDPMIDEYLDGLEHVDLDEFNFDSQLDKYELKAELPHERKVEMQPVAAELRRKRENALRIVDKGNDRERNPIRGTDANVGAYSRRASAASTTSSEDDAPVSSVYKRKFHSTYMKQRVSSLPRGVVKSNTAKRLHTMDLLDRRPAVEGSQIQSPREERRASTQLSEQHAFSSPETFGVPNPSKSRSPIRHGEEHDGHDDAEFGESPSRTQQTDTSQVSTTSKKKKTAEIEMAKETWNFKDNQTANAWEKWAKKRRKFKKDAVKKKVPEDPMERFKRLQRKVGHAPPVTKTRKSIAAASNTQGGQMFTRRSVAHNSVSASMQSSQSNDIDIESVSSIRSQDFSSMRPVQQRATGQVPLHQHTYTFPENASGIQQKQNNGRKRRT